MDIPSKHVFEALIEKGIDKLHHANSVLTACHFLRAKSLMSRGTIERLGVKQTPQKSDDIDRKSSIWFDVFADSVDIHGRASRANVYGPVMFVFNTKIIDRTGTGRIWVTKLNPTKWSGKSADQRWFQDKDDLDKNLVKGRFDQMLVLRHCGGALPFKSYLEKIVVDDPDLLTSDDVDIYSMAVGALRLAMQDSGLDVPIERRRCRNTCECKDYWSEDNERLFKMFDPKL